MNRYLQKIILENEELINNDKDKQRNEKVIGIKEEKIERI